MPRFRGFTAFRAAKRFIREWFMMEMQVVIEMFFGVLGGLGIFLLGMKNMSDGLQAVGGDGMRKIIHRLTTNRFTSVGVGFLITAFIQSSSVTTVMSVGLVNSGLMTLRQSIGVVMGANIGTTLTGWILVLKIGKYGLPILGLAAFFYLFSRKDRLRFWGMAIMGLGMVFFGLQLMKNGFKPLRSVPEFEQMFLRFSADSYWGMMKCVLIGCVLTMIVQSSSATLGITMGLASTGAIPFTTAAALVLGENIGTTITATLSAIGATSTAKRTARAHMIFNVIGVLWVTSLFPFFLSLVKSVIGVDPDLMIRVAGEPTYPNMLKGIASVHTGFNVINTLIFLPFVSHMEKIVTRMVPERRIKPKSYLTYVNMRMIEAPSIAIEQSRNEIQYFSETVLFMLRTLADALQNGPVSSKTVAELFHKEEKLDMIQSELLEFLTHLMSANVTTHLVEEARRQIRLAAEYESLSDYIVRILKLHLRLIRDGQNWSDSKKKEIGILNEKVIDFVALLNKLLRDKEFEPVNEKDIQTPMITRQIKEVRTSHLERLSDGNISPLESTSYIDLLNCYRKINDHSYNILEIMAYEK
jgi:phosphate:Na+ symporter